ncbi:hypothetical protein DEFDS_0831 [Deferribacter desulfuricans SSM1]|uniref:Outer membrane lipoprotein BamD-like domain-containing protein n=1 Tax=Deferribacter desulfuricans (strain DSM 14783 / JCM 11476 / NBRC 101012 / SSM1) TaxID=639282 RepID=D3PCI4_DEFDS|nr:tetratricopeptide repeat protein [Deferribacter desulfuricans]BAI80307.1 hypothetical protein DEFDS_0831 [Deferribacter desulfuricans SSM1]
MIKKICLFLLFSVSVFAYGIYVNESEFATEIKIDNIKPFISEITKSDNSLIIKLTTSAKLSSIKKFQNKFVDKLEVKDDKMIVKFNDNVDYFYRYDDNNLLLIFAPRKEISDIKLKSIIEKPILKAKSKKIKDADAEKVLAEADEYVNNGLYNNAITKLLDLISTHKNDFYAQEAYYKLGMVYYKLGEDDPKNYLKAADYLADFASKFPDHYLASDALYYSALSKEKAGMYYEAIFDYKRVILTYPNTLNAKKSYFKIVNIYENIGQYDKAINALKEYSDKFEDNSVEVLARIGKLYFLLKDIELAKEYFIKIIDKKNDILKLGPDTLFAIAKTFEVKGEIDYAINIYSKIYNIYPESKYADLAMYNTALLMEKKGKDRLADSLLLECKDKYKNRQGGEKAAIHYAEKHLKEQPTEYWLDFFSDILSKSSDVNNMAKANRLIIESFYYSKRYDEALASIKEFEAKFFDSLELNRVYDIKQKIYLEYAKRFLKEGNYSLSKSYVDKLLQEFPDSKYRVEAAKISESISLIIVRKEFTNTKYEKALSLAQDYLLNHKSIYFKTEWDKLIGDLYYRLYKKALKEGNEVKAVALAKEYMVYYPNGKYKGEFLDYIFNYLMKMTLNYIKNGDYIKVIKLYSDNSGWIKKMNK